MKPIQELEEQKSGQSARSTLARDWLICVLMFVISMAVFSPALSADFVAWDDDIDISKNPNISSMDGAHLQWMFTNFSYSLRYMPLSWVMWSTVYHFFGLEPSAYHCLNLVLHGVNIILVFWVIRGLLILSNLGSSLKRTLCAAVAALIWGLHPLRVEVVAWATAATYGLSLCFLLSSLLCYLRYASADNARLRLICFWFAVALFGFSLLSYPPGLMYPIVLLVLDVMIFGVIPSRFAPGSNKMLRALLVKIPFFALSLGFVLLTIWARAHAMGTWTRTATMMQDFSVVHRISQSFYIWAYYLWKPFVPTNLSPVYTNLVSFDPVSFPFVLSAGVVIVISASLFLLRRRWPILLAVWICYLALLIPMLGLTEHPHYSSDRYGHIVSILGSVLLSIALVRLWNDSRKRLIALVVLCAVTGLLASLSFRQTYLWKNSTTLFQGMIAKLGEDPYRSHMYRRLGEVFTSEGKFGDASAQFTEALRIVPGDTNVLGKLAFALAQNGKLDEAITCYEGMIQQNPSDPGLHNDLGNTLATQRRFEEARIQYEAALRLKPDFAEARNNLASTFVEQNKFPEALAELRSALKSHPDDVGALNNLSWLLATCPDRGFRDGPEAVRLAKRAVELSEQNDPGILDTLARAYAASGDFAQATKVLEQAFKLCDSKSRKALRDKIGETLEAYRHQSVLP